MDDVDVADEVNNDDDDLAAVQMMVLLHDYFGEGPKVGGGLAALS